MEEHEAKIEDWWETGSLDTIDNFYQWLCIDQLKLCCPQGTFGKNCRQCQRGDNGQICSGNGECDVHIIKSLWFDFFCIYMYIGRWYTNG